MKREHDTPAREWDSEAQRRNVEAMRAELESLRITNAKLGARVTDLIVERDEARQVAADRASGDPAVRGLLLHYFGTTETELLAESLRELFDKATPKASNVPDDDGAVFESERFERESHHTPPLEMRRMTNFEIGVEQLDAIKAGVEPEISGRTELLEPQEIDHGE